MILEPMYCPMYEPMRVGDEGAAQPSFPLLTGLVSYLDLSEASGQRNDSHTNGYHFAQSGGVGSAAGVGAGQTAADFVAASSQFLSRSINSDLAGVVPFSRLIWCRPNSLALMPLISCLKGGGQDGHRLQLQADGTMQWWCANSSATDIVTSTDTLSAAAWAMIYAAYDGVQLKLSINNGTIKTAAAAGTYNAVTETTYYIGRWVGAGFWDGRLAATPFYNRELTADEITAYYNGGTAALLYADVAAYTG